MNRRGDPQIYLDLLAEIRAVLPDAMLRSTFLIGFPGETDADFDALLEFQERARLDWLGSFGYSREEGTAAAALKGRVPAKTVSARKRALETAQERITRERLERFVGRELDILVEEPLENGPAKAGADGGATGQSRDEASFTLGRAWLQAPEVDGLTVLRGTFLPGSRVRARVLAVAGVDLDAEQVATGAGRS
jgi:ribosomal protein S12 methylthiotransferase